MRILSAIILIFLGVYYSYSQEYLVVAKSGLVIRDQPTLKSNRIGKYEENKIIKVVKETTFGLEVESINGFWFQVSYDNKPAYVFSGFLKAIDKVAPQEMALNFYKWYLKNYYEQGGIQETPSIEQDQKNTFYLDYDSHKKSLDSTGYFSEKYFDNNLDSYKACEEALLKVSHEKVQQCGCNPAEFTGNECTFSFYSVWTNCQGEPVDTVELDAYVETTEGVLVTINLGYMFQGKNYEYSKSRVLMINENGKWKISKIDV